MILETGFDVIKGEGIHINTHMWQSQVENEHYSIVYFDCTPALKALYLRTFVKGGDRTCCVEASHIDATMQRV